MENIIKDYNNNLKFNKYKLYGDYHHRWYETKDSYRNNVNFLKSWVKEKNVIDIGAGDGVITSLLGIRGIDINTDAIKCANLRGIKIDLGSVYKLPYKDQEFESALVTDTIEHLEFLDNALQEIRRVIQKYLYTNIIIRDNFKEPEHYHRWTVEQFINDIERNGFVLEGKPIAQFKRYYFKFKKNGKFDNNILY